MKVLVIGKGGREHAIADAFHRSRRVTKIYAAPGNPGMAEFAQCVDIAAENVAELVRFAKATAIDLTVVGPEASLALGIVDAFQNAGLKIFGPTQAAAQIESSKDFAKSLMRKYGIPTAAYQTFANFDDAWGYVQKQGVPIVIKEDGLKAGKGVSVVHTMDDALAALKAAFAIADNKVVIEEYLSGFEFSLICFVCDDVVLPMEIAQDHKCAYDNDQGPNTGGMGVYSPVKTITEAEVILPRLKTDIADVIENILCHQPTTLEWDSQVVLGVVMASAGYPKSATKGARITGLDQVKGKVFHMGTAICDGQLVSDGGRVLLVSAKAPTLQAAYENAYADVARIQCDALFYRHDIGKKDM